MPETTGSAATLVRALRKSGGWAGAVPTDELLALFTDTDETYYRAHLAYATHGSGVPAYGEIRGAYVLGHLAGLDPDFTGYDWSEVGPQLAHAWSAATAIPWSEAERFARAAFERAASAKAASWRGSHRTVSAA